MEEAVHSMRAEASLDWVCPGQNDSLIMILIQKMTNELLKLFPCPQGESSIVFLAEMPCAGSCADLQLLDVQDSTP